MSTQQINEFKLGQMYSSEEIQQSLGVGNAGGVRVAIGNEDCVRRVVIMTSVPTARQARENPYHDRMEGDILVYTGAGREGEQSLAGVNKRLPQQGTDAKLTGQIQRLSHGAGSCSSSCRETWPF